MSDESLSRVQRLRAALPLGPVQLLDLEQKFFLRLAALLPFLTLPVTAVFNLLPGFFLL